MKISHFEKYPFEERLYYWQQRENYRQVWQTTDIIRLQFESNFDPIIVSVEFVLNVQSIADTVQPETDRILGNL